MAIYYQEMLSLTPRQWGTSFLALLLIIGGIWYFWPQGEVVNQLDRRLDQLMRLVEKEGSETNFEQIAVAREVQGFFTEDASIMVGPPVNRTVSGSREIQQAVLGGRRQAQTLSLRSYNRQAEVAEDQQSAIMEVTITASGDVGGSSHRDRRRFMFQWVRQGGDWLIQEIELLNVED